MYIVIHFCRFGRVGGQKWDWSSEEYEYDSRGLLSSITTSTYAITRYTFGEARLVGFKKLNILLSEIFLIYIFK